MQSVCNSININRKLIMDWNKQFPQLKDATINKTNTLCKGMNSCLFSFSDTLLSFIFELRKQGMAINTSMTLMKAGKISRQFCEKSQEAQISCVQHSVKVQGWYTAMEPMNLKRFLRKPKLKHWTLCKSYVQSFDYNVVTRLLF